VPTPSGEGSHIKKLPLFPCSKIECIHSQKRFALIKRQPRSRIWPPHSNEDIPNAGFPVRTKLDLESIVSELYSPLHRFAFALTRNETQAADLTQETFLILAKQHAQVRDVTKIKSWLFTTLRHEFLRSLRTRSSHPEVELEPEHQDQLFTHPAMFQAADAATALKAMAQVDDGYRMVLELFYQADLSYKQIATTLDLPIGTVMSRLSRGKEQLRTLLAKTTAPELFIRETTRTSSLGTKFLKCRKPRSSVVRRH
jgi:RNA polymerase sigma factor (sigma-70 family)